MPGVRAQLANGTTEPLHRAVKTLQFGRVTPAVFRDSPRSAGEGHTACRQIIKPRSAAAFVDRLWAQRAPSAQHGNKN